jgi:hypothetical protein
VKPKVTKPKCRDCKTADCHVVALRDPLYPDRLRHVFLCGSCEYRLDHPDAPRPVKLPRERSKRLQKETLFPGDGA